MQESGTSHLRPWKNSRVFLIFESACGIVFSLNEAEAGTAETQLAEEYLSRRVEVAFQNAGGRAGNIGFPSPSGFYLTGLN